MLYYIFDGSFDGLLTAVYEAYYRREEPDLLLPCDDGQDHLLVHKVAITTDEAKAQKVYGAIGTKISHQALRHVFYAYLSEVENSSTFIYHYLKMGFKIGSKVDSYLTDDRVIKVHDLSRKVGSERHRMLGLIRFRALEGSIYYGPIEPQYNIIGLMAGHFVKRLSNQHWVIHDVKRGTAAVYNQREWTIREVDVNYKDYLTHEEILFQKLWKTYFDSTAIKNRLNPKLQRSNMPKKYWNYLIEKGNK